MVGHVKRLVERDDGYIHLARNRSGHPLERMTDRRDPAILEEAETDD